MKPYAEACIAVSTVLTRMKFRERKLHAFRSAILMSQMCANHFPWECQRGIIPQNSTLPSKVLLLMSTQHY